MWKAEIIAFFLMPYVIGGILAAPFVIGMVVWIALKACYDLVRARIARRREAR